MKLLYNADFSPITETIGLLATNIDVAAEAYSSWMGKIQSEHGRQLRTSRLTGALRDVLPHILPLTVPGIKRCLFVPTASPWVAYFDSSISGTDASPVVSHMSLLLKCRSVRITAVSEERERARPVGGGSAAAIFEYFESHNTDWLNRIRTISMMNDGHWIFEADGEEQPFEEPAYYEQRKIKDRFPLELLDRYLKALGIDAFNPDFYMPPGTQAVLVEKVGKWPKPVQEFTLEQSFSRFADRK